MRPISLKSKLIVAVFGLIIGSSVLTALLVNQRYSKSLNESAAAQAENIAHSIALEAAEKILVNDRVTLQKTLDYHIRSNPSVSYIFILRDGYILAHTFSRGVPIDLISANSINAGNTISFKNIVSKTDERFIDIAWPIFDGKAGVLRLGLSEKHYKTQLAKLWIEMSMLTVGTLIVALIVSLLFIRKATQPLSKLAETAEKIDEGRLDLQVRLTSRDEVGKVAQSFNKMIRRIKDYTLRLEEKNMELDRAHQQTRTSFLISQEINALIKLDDVCAYLIKKLRSIVICNDMAVLIFNHGNNALFFHSEQEFSTLPDDQTQTTYELLAQLASATFIRKDQINLEFFPETFRVSEKLVTFPLCHDAQFLGAMLIACPGDCSCVTMELDIIQMILAQSSGAIRRAAAHEEEIRELRTRIEHSSGFSGLIGKNPQMQVVYKLIEDVAPTDATVLIQGESGTGKELVAGAIHNQSLRKNKPFVVINCSAYPATLLESELFGHEKGAFTGAVRQKAGRFEQADGGTVFLDEIGEISPPAQIKLLRILQSQKFERVGGEDTLVVNLRILAATNKDLLQAVKDGNFREDLFYRLNVIPIHLPPLRERRNDIPLLAQHFLKQFSAEQNKEVQRFSSEAMRLLLDYDWPGNVRELENSIEHATVLAKDRNVEVADLPTAIQHAETKAPTASNRTILENERKLLKEVLEECGWNKKEASLRLGISRSTLYDKLKKYQISKPTIH